MATKNETIAEAVASSTLQGKALTADQSSFEVQLVKVSLPMVEDPDTGRLHRQKPDIVDGSLDEFELIHLHGKNKQGQDIRFWVDHASFPYKLEFTADLLRSGTWEVTNPRFVAAGDPIDEDDDGNPVVDAKGNVMQAKTAMFLCDFGTYILPNS